MIFTTAFGFSAFREGQKEAMNSLLSGHSTLAIFSHWFGQIFVLPVCRYATTTI